MNWCLASTKLHANGSHHTTRGNEQIVREILADAETIGLDEDEQFAEHHGELPPRLERILERALDACATRSEKPHS